MTGAELIDVAEVERLALGPDDMLVLKSPMLLSEDEHAEIAARLRALLPPGTKILVLEAGLDISVLRASE